MYFTKLISVIYLFIPVVCYGWGSHYLVTDRALSVPALKTQISQEVKVESLDHFLKDQKENIGLLFKNYYLWLQSTGSKRFVAIDFDQSQGNTEAFLKAARLNPRAKFHYLTRLLPNQKNEKALIDFKKISFYEKVEKNYDYRFEEIPFSAPITVGAILNTYSDEPDWGIDGELWGYSEYGYGKIPYGKPKGESSAAPFHLQFSHENWIVKKFAPEILDGMTFERIELFQRLAQLAFKSGHLYWGYRFTAWGLHYIQDLSQPYHSKAVPSADLFYYLKFAFSFQKEKIKKESTQLLTNRHHLYEDFVKLILQDFYSFSGKNSEQFSDALQKGSQILLDQSESWSTEKLKEFIHYVTEMSSEQAFKVDKAISQAYGARLVQDPSYNFESDFTFDSRVAFQNMNPKFFRDLIQVTLKNFELTGSATRTFLESTIPKKFKD